MSKNWPQNSNDTNSMIMNYKLSPVTLNIQLYRIPNSPNLPFKYSLPCIFSKHDCQTLGDIFYSQGTLFANLKYPMKAKM